MIVIPVLECAILTQNNEPLQSFKTQPETVSPVFRQPEKWHNT
ncbi:hypothetical protein [Kingella negevensis]|nr:hypothetical protein [Kingella negevensis]MDK4680003.1 hypothetical protein [Kingella negevensis]MDK4682277.1 hypothetical protein [Kingella negevensis]MDK4684845.1 hypothetical protein [Kingella negevensis]MDK4688298.1 hypothetical protein [Kingella negevensis]MDK4690474.1 hypothetical protein [Kingella negevensis]